MTISYKSLFRNKTLRVGRDRDHNMKPLTFSTQIFGENLEEMQEDLEQGDVAETVKSFYEKSTSCPPQKKSILSIQQVDAMLTELAKFTKEDDQQRVLTRITKK